MHYRWKLYLGVALISLSALMLEIGLTRIFSVMFASHYVFLLISLAILGLGLGGIFVHLQITNSDEPPTIRLRKYLLLSSGLMSLSILIMPVLIIKIPLFQLLTLMALLAGVPFFWGGMFLASAFHLYPDRSAYIYAADLAGAAVGAILAVVLLSLGGAKLMVVVALIAALPAGLHIFEESIPKFNRFSFLFVAASPIFLLNFAYDGASLGTIPFSRAADKEMTSLLEHPAKGARVLESRWSAFGRTDLVETADDPDRKVFFIDGTAGTNMYRYDGQNDSLDKFNFQNFSGSFPFEILPEEQKRKVLIIGAGGGREVLISLLAGAKDITAVEVNKDLVDLMKKNSAFNGGIYDGFPGVKVVTEEGRSFVRSTKEKYDIIMLSIPVTKTSRSPEGFALTENFLFTAESIDDYLDKLTTNGRIIVVAHEAIEIYRLIFTGLKAFEKKGIPVADAMKHIYTVGPDMFPVLVLKKTPLTPEEAGKVHQNMHRRDYSTLSSFIPFVEQKSQYLPVGKEIYLKEGMLNEDFYRISQGLLSPDELVSGADIDVKAVTDDKPFFYKFDLGLPGMIRLLLILAAGAMIGGWFIQPGYGREKGQRGKNAFFLLLFSLLGIGFMLIEIALFQKFILFLGQPVHSVAVLLFSLLIGAGLGSWFSGYLWQSSTLMKLRLSAMMVSILTGLYILFLAPVFTNLLGLPFFVRTLISFLLLFPLGFFLGMPFSLAMKLLDEWGLQHHVPWMWGINGIGSVLGSSLAIAMAVSFGFSRALILGALIYFSLFLAFSSTSYLFRKPIH